MFGYDLWEPTQSSGSDAITDINWTNKMAFSFFKNFIASHP